MRRLFMIAVIGAICTMVVPQWASAQQFSFQYNIQISVQATVNAAGIRFENVQFVPTPYTPDGVAYFEIGSTGACNIQMLARYGNRFVQAANTGPVYAGIQQLAIPNVRRGDFQEFFVTAFDCAGNRIAQDRVTFWTPPPEIVTHEQWQTVSISQRTVRVGYR